MPRKLPGKMPRKLEDAVRLRTIRKPTCWLLDCQPTASQLKQTRPLGEEPQVMRVGRAIGVPAKANGGHVRQVACPQRQRCNPLEVRSARMRRAAFIPMSLAAPPTQIALGDQREAKPISERSRCGPVPWTVRPIGRTIVPAHTRGYFFGASLALAGAAATQAPLPSLPPFSSHFILAYSQSVLLAGVVACCANAIGASASTAITAVMGSSFMSDLHGLPRSNRG